MASAGSSQVELDDLQFDALPGDADRGGDPPLAWVMLRCMIWRVKVGLREGLLAAGIEPCSEISANRARAEQLGVSVISMVFIAFLAMGITVSGGASVSLGLRRDRTKGLVGEVQATAQPPMSVAGSKARWSASTVTAPLPPKNSRGRSPTCR